MSEGRRLVVTEKGWGEVEYDDITDVSLNDGVLVLQCADGSRIYIKKWSDAEWFTGRTKAERIREVVE